MPLPEQQLILCVQRPGKGAAWEAERAHWCSARGWCWSVRSWAAPQGGLSAMRHCCSLWFWDNPSVIYGKPPECLQECWFGWAVLFAFWFPCWKRLVFLAGRVFWNSRVWRQYQTYTRNMPSFSSLIRKAFPAVICCHKEVSGQGMLNLFHFFANFSFLRLIQGRVVN